jgi:hypothetical protein
MSFTFRCLALSVPLLLMIHCSDQVPQRRRAVFDGGALPDHALPPADSSDSLVMEDDGGVSCSHGTYFNGHCYFTAGLGEMDYSSGKDLCKNLGAEPASIHSEAENKFIYGLLFKISSGGWIGLKRDSSDFAWEDGSKLSYTNWAPDEPGDDDCAVIVGPYEDEARRATWEVGRCSETQDEIVCQRLP